MLKEKELEFLRRLADNQVDFIIIGMSAAVLQGAPALTEDVDLWFRDPNDPKIRKAAESLGGKLLDLSAFFRPSDSRERRWRSLTRSEPCTDSGNFKPSGTPAHWRWIWGMSGSGC